MPNFHPFIYVSLTIMNPESHSHTFSLLKARQAPSPLSHLECILHMDDAALQNGRADWRDLECTPMPYIPLPCCNGVSHYVCHHRLLLLFVAPGNEGLRLDDGCFGYHSAGSAVVNFSKNGDDFTC